MLSLWWLLHWYVIIRSLRPAPDHTTKCKLQCTISEMRKYFPRLHLPQQSCATPKLSYWNYTIWIFLHPMQIKCTEELHPNAVQVAHHGAIVTFNVWLLPSRETCAAVSSTRWTQLRNSLVAESEGYCTWPWTRSIHLPFSQPTCY